MEQEHRLAEDALRDGEAASRLIVDRIPGIVLFMTPDGELAFVNHPVRAYFGKTLEQLKHWWKDDTVHPDDRAHAFDIFTRATGSGEPYKFEARFRRFDGTYRWFQCRGVPDRDEAGRIVRWYAMGVDIDERKRAEEALRLSEARRATAERDLQLMIDTIPVFVAAYEPDGTRSFVNQTWQQYMGLTAAEATGPNARKAFPHFHPEDAERIDGAWRASLASGQSLLTEARVRRADGQYRWHTSHRVPLHDERGKIIRWYSVGVDIDNQKSAEEGLRRSEARLAAAERELQLTIDTIPTLVATYLPDGSRIFVNQTWRDYLGLRPGDAVDAFRTAVVHPDDAARVLEEWQRCLTAELPFSAEMRLRRADGVYRWHTVHRVLARDESGAVVKWYSVGVDIEEQKRSEERLRQSETRLAEAERDLQLTVDTIPTLVTAYRPDGSRIFVNRSWQEYSGISRDEAFGPARWSLVHPNDLERADEEWLRGMAAEVPFKSEVRLRRADGEYRWHVIHRVFSRDEDGNIAKWYSTAVDIEDRKRAEEKLRESEHNARLIIDSIPGLVAIFTPDGEFEFVNRQILEYSGITLDDVTSKRVRTRDTLHPGDFPRATELFKQSIASGESFEFEVRVRRFDGAYRWFQSRGLPLRDTNGRISRWYNLLIDIDERKRTEEALQHSEARLAGTLDSIPTMTWRAAANGYVQSLNKRWFDYTGSTPDQSERNGWRSFVHPDDLTELAESGRRNIPAGRPVDAEARLRRFDGEYRRFMFRVEPMRDESGEISAWYGAITDIEDRKRAEDAFQQSQVRLAETERDLRIMLDSIPTITWRAGANGYVQYLNKKWFEYTGTTHEQVRGWRWKLCVHPEDIDQLVEAGSKYVGSGVPIDSEARLRRHDGEYRWFLFRPAAVRDEAGDVVAWYGTITDIEDRKRAEQKALEAEREVQRTIDNIPVLVGTYSAEGKRLSVNKWALEVTGLSADDIPGEGWNRAFHPDDLEAINTEWRECLARGETFEREVRTRMADGTYRAHLTRRLPLRDEAGRVIRWYGIAHDIEDQRRAEAELRRSEAFLAEGQAVSSTGTFSWRVDTNELKFSDELCRIFELDQTTPITAERIFSRVHPEDVPILSDRMKLVRDGRVPGDQEVRLRMRDGRIKYLRMVGQMMQLDGRSEYLAAAQDITQRRLAEEATNKVRSELAHVTRVMSLGALTASIAHEVNQPLAGIITNASTCLRMLAADPPNVDGARETARRTIRDGNRAADVITRLRALFGRKAAVTEAIDLNEATREVVALLFSDLLRNRVIVRVELGDEPLIVTGDRVQLQQVILNLVRNASDAMSEVSDRPRNLLVRASREQDGSARLTVTDAGIGLEPQTAERLFDAFYTSKSDGMGIGLSVSRSIIESHGGKIWAEMNDGPGATFSFSIPPQGESAGDEGITDAILTRPTKGAHDRTRNA